MILRLKRYLCLKTKQNSQSCSKTQTEPAETKNNVEEEQCNTALNPIAKKFAHSGAFSTTKATILFDLSKRGASGWVGFTECTLKSLKGVRL